MLHPSVIEFLAACRQDPLMYVMGAFPWEEDISIQKVPLDPKYHSRFPGCRWGPDRWQCEFLDQLGEDIKLRNFDGHNPVAAIRNSVVSGHGIGKSTLTAWLTKFILDTRPYSVGTVTANTASQLRTKTWAEVGKWHNISITKEMFKYTLSSNQMSLEHVDNDLKGRWKCFAHTCDVGNSESFAGQHSDATSFYIFDEACHDDQTEVLTDAGWLLFKDVRPEHRLMTPAGWQHPEAIHSSYRDGHMIQFKKRGLSVLVTPNHNMWGQEYYSKRWVKKRADQVPYNFTVPRTVEWSAEDLKVTDNYLKLLGWFFSEGHILKNTYKPKNRPPKHPYHGVGISNHTDRGISSLLTSMKLNWRKSNNQWLIYNPALGELFASYGEGCLNKTLPEWMFTLSQRQMRVFLSVFLEGDGYQKTKKRGILYTSSKPLSDSLHALAVLAGYNSSVTVRKIKDRRKWIKDHWAKSTADGYVVSLAESDKSSTRLSPDQAQKIDYKGRVYCATVPAGILMTRREGTVVWSGNSKIDEVLFDVREGGLKGGEPMVFDFGNGTRNVGRFKENCVGKYRHRGRVWSIDSREAYRTNKAEIAEEVKEYGEDSDYVRVRIRGLFPKQASSQFISTEHVELAQARLVPHLTHAAPLYIGVDVAFQGDDSTVIYPRLGDDARSYPPRQFRGLDPEQIANEVKDYVKEFKGIGFRPVGIFIDGGGGYGSGVHTHLRQLGIPSTLIYPGRKAIKEKDYGNRITEMWAVMRDAIKGGLCLPDSDSRIGKELFEELTEREGEPTLSGQVKLVSKTKLVKSPDIADALALTFAQEAVGGVNGGGPQVIQLFEEDE